MKGSHLWYGILLLVPHAFVLFCVIFFRILLTYALRTYISKQFNKKIFYRKMKKYLAFLTTFLISYKSFLKWMVMCVLKAYINQTPFLFLFEPTHLQLVISWDVWLDSASWGKFLKLIYHWWLKKFQIFVNSSNYKNGGSIKNFGNFN